MQLTELPDGAQRLPRKALAAWRIEMLTRGLFFVLLLGAAGTATLMMKVNVFFVAAGGVVVLALAGALMWFIPTLRYRFYFYLVSSDQLMVQRGALFVSRVTVPFARIQNVETTHGPIDRWLGLINIKISTAASPVYITHLGAETGEQIRDDVVARVKAVRDDLVDD